MMTFLQFTFHCFWHFLGVGLLISAVFHGLAAVILAMRGNR